MWSPRAQNDRMVLEKWRLILERNKNVDFWQEMIVNVVVEKTRLLVLKHH